jgi:hypothetical protein
MIAAARRIAAPGAGAEGALAADQERQAALARTLHDLSDRVGSFDWTLDELRELHLALSREMNREAEAILALDRTTSKAPALIMIA